MKKPLHKLKGIILALVISSNSFAQTSLYTELFDQTHTGTKPDTVPFVMGSANSPFVFSEANSYLKVDVSSGHGEWDNWVYILNNGTKPKTIAMTSKTVVYVRAYAVNDAAYTETYGTLAISLIDTLGHPLNNAVVNGVNKFRLAATPQTFQLTVTQWNDQYGSGANVDSNRINKVQFAVNPAFASYPGTNNSGDPIDMSYEGIVYIDYISIGADVTTGVASSAAKYDFNIYPNPSSGIVGMTFPDNVNNGKIRVYNSLGKEVYANEVFGSQAYFNLATLEKGVYTVEVSNNGMVGREKLVIE